MSKLVLPSHITAPIVEWDAQKGYGFLQVGEGKVFLHRNEFAEFHKRPQIGDLIQFSVGLDAQGRTCAKKAAHYNDGGRITLKNGALLASLLVLPSIALFRGRLDLRWTVPYAVIISIISYNLYARDKRKARDNTRRISENKLHLSEALGGWPGAYVAQRRLRHKCSKLNYQIVFWLIVFAHQFAALDSLLDWRISHHTISSIASKLRN